MRWLFTCIILFFISDISLVMAADKFAYKKTNIDELKVILKNHKSWLSDYKKNPSFNIMSDKRHANLSRYDLSGFDLRNMDFTEISMHEANLIGTQLSFSKLIKVELWGANLTNASMIRTNLKFAEFNHSIMTGASFTEANLDESTLHEAILDSANFYKASLIGADIKNASLNNVDFRAANLTKAQLEEVKANKANMGMAILIEATLNKATILNSDFTNANLTKANLNNANLTGSIFQDAYLMEADLRGTNLSGADFSGSDMAGVNFEPKKIPSADGIAYANNLHKMTYITTPFALVKIRNSLRDAGYREQEREITYAINHKAEVMVMENETLISKIEVMFKYVFFNLPTQWGMFPSRALLILLVLMIVFSIPYSFIILSNGSSGIYRKWNKIHVEVDKKSHWNKGRKNVKEKAYEIDRVHYSGYRAILFGLYFSLLSAFNIGFREINVGNWITRIQPRDYTFTAIGLVRSVSGVQSLISVYLVAMWVLTYFGRPFG